MDTQNKEQESFHYASSLSPKELAKRVEDCAGNGNLKELSVLAPLIPKEDRSYWPFKDACLNGHLEVIRFFTEEVVYPFDHRLTLWTAVHSKNTHLVRYLHAAGYGYELDDKIHQGELFEAAASVDSWPMVECLRDLGLMWNDAALCSACSCGYASLVRQMLRADVPRSPRCWEAAVHSNDTFILRELKSGKCPMDSTAVIEAFQSKDFKSLKWLYKNGYVEKSIVCLRHELLAMYGQFGMLCQILNGGPRDEMPDPMPAIRGFPKKLLRWMKFDLAGQHTCSCPTNPDTGEREAYHPIFSPMCEIPHSSSNVL